MPVSLDLIRSFAVVATTGSLSAAARELSMTQPTIGRHIDLLENDLKVSLFTRSRDGMALTSRGEELVEAAQALLFSASGFERRAAGLEADLAGVLRLSVNEILGVMVLPRLLTGFMEQHPDIEIELDITNRATNLLHRDADIAVRMFRPTQKDLVARKLGEIPIGLFAHIDYLEKHGSPKTLGELALHRSIGFDRDQTMIRQAAILGADLGRADFALRTDNNLAHVEAIRNGLGIGVTQVHLAASWPNVMRVLPDLNLPPLELWIACHSDVRYNTRIRLMMDYLADQLPRAVR